MQCRNLPSAFFLLCREFPSRDLFIEADKSKKIRKIERLQDSKYLEYFLLEKKTGESPHKGGKVDALDYWVNGFGFCLGFSSWACSL
jgi:hypothetical protein